MGDLTGRDAARLAVQELERRTQFGDARGHAYATLALALATAGRWDNPEPPLDGEVLCGAVFTAPDGEQAECELPDGHEGVHVGHLLSSLRIQSPDV